LVALLEGDGDLPKLIAPEEAAIICDIVPCLRSGLTIAAPAAPIDEGV